MWINPKIFAKNAFGLQVTFRRLDIADLESQMP